MSLLDVTWLTIRYGDNVVVDNVDLFVERGESVGLVGESGSGKTQSVLAVLGLLSRRAQVSGSIEFDGHALHDADEAGLDTFRGRRIGMVFQDPMLSLNPYLRVGHQLRQILLRHGLARGADADARVVDMLERVGLPDPRRQFRAYPHEMSGGIRQRAMLAAALIAEPELLIADEPTTALDVTVQAQILELLEEIRDDTALLLITHDLGVIAGYCEHMIVLERGRVVDAGPTTSLFAAPKHEHTRRLIQSAPRVDRGTPPAAVSSSTVLSVGNAVVDYADLRAVDDVSFAVQAGETVAVVGESGSGKSTTARCITGLLPPTSGEILFKGQALPPDYRNRTKDQLRQAQMIYQMADTALNPKVKISEIIGRPAQFYSGLHGPDLKSRVDELLDLIELDPSQYYNRYPPELSGGRNHH